MHRGLLTFGARKSGILTLALLWAAGCATNPGPGTTPAAVSSPVVVEYALTLSPETRTVAVHGQVRGVSPGEIKGWGNPEGRPDTYGAPDIVPDTVEAAPGGVRFAYTLRVPQKEQVNSTEPAFEEQTLRAWGWHLFATPVLTRAPERVTVRIDAPAEWTVATSLGEGRGPVELPTLEDVRGLAVFAGDVRTTSFRGAGIPVHLAVRRKHPVPDSVLQRALASILEVATDRFGVNPLERLMFGLDLLRGRPTFAPGNSVTTPVLNSVLLLNGDDVANEIGFFPTLAHETLHAWIPDLFGAGPDVKRELGGFFTEGFTNYLAYKVARDAGLLTRHQLLWMLSKDVVEYRYIAGPAREQYGQMLDYHQGMIIAWILDAELLRETEGRYGIWEFLRLLGKRYARGGLTRETFRSTLAELGGERVGGLYDELTGAGEPIDVAAWLEGTGVRFRYDSDPRAAFRAFRASGTPVVTFEPTGAKQERLLSLMFPCGGAACSR